MRSREPVVSDGVLAWVVIAAALVAAVALALWRRLYG